jgi:hypothetical protein
MSTMQFQDVGEAVEVIALFRDGRLSPLKFRWKQRVLRVRQVNSDWESEIGTTRFRHFAVMSDGPDVFELSYNEQNFVWKLEKVALSG